MGDKLAVAMSGGVDSSVAAWRLREQGFDLTGVTLRLHGCAGMEGASDARAVAEQLGETGRILVRESGTEPVIRVM